MLYDAQGEVARSEPIYQRILKIVETAYGKDHPNTAAVLTQYAAHSRKAGNAAQAKSLEDRAAAINGR